MEGPYLIISATADGKYVLDGVDDGDEFEESQLQLAPHSDST